ncbi:MAG: alpha/beta fold hydrolase [Streptosporangiaceae bacterium]
MAAFALIHGAADVGWYWHLVERELDWPAHAGLAQVMAEQARRDGGQTGSHDPLVAFYHDVPRALAEQAVRNGGRRQSDTPGRSPWPLSAWPAIPTRFILCTEDRLFPAGFMRRVAAERLGVVPDEIAAGHCVALSRPRELAGMLT